MRKPHSILLIVIFALISFGHTIQALTPLPASDWYAVIWNRTDDTLHWVNSVTELASIPRPKLPNEGNAGADLYISPDGRWMMVAAPLQNQRHGLGFYDLQTGEWLQTHQAEPGEQIIAAERNPFTHNSAFAAIGLHSEAGWRVIAFETATGDAIGQLAADHPGIAADYVPVQAVPSVALYDLEQNFGTWRVHIRFVTQGPAPNDPHQPSLVWFPELDTVQTGSFHPLLLDFDVLPVQGRVLYSLRDQNTPTHSRIYNQTLGHEGEVNFDTAGAFATQPRWVANGQFVAFRVSQDPHVPMWHIKGVASSETIPFGPDYDELLGTSDGFIIIDYEGGEVKFSNTLAFEAFTPTVGNVIYTTESSNFHVAYITPIGTQFALTDLAVPPEGPVVVGGADTVQVPDQTCGTAPPPRLTVGETARVAFTDGSSLNVRTAAAGEFIMEIAEGTSVEITGGPVCADNYFWWELRLQSGNITVGGWAAEGDSSAYWLEPFTITQIDPGALQPTAVPPRAIDPTPARASVPGDGDCANAPVGAELTVGEFASTNTQGTLAMRTNLNDEFPSYNIPDNRTLNVLDGPVCNKGFRMWYVSLNLDGTSVEGWVADGFGSNRYLSPGPARAQ